MLLGRTPHHPAFLSKEENESAALVALTGDLRGVVAP